MHDHEKCRELFAKLSQYIDNELDPTNYHTIEAHLEKCSPCKACLATLRRTVAMCRELRASSMPAEASKRLHEMIKQML